MVAIIRNWRPDLLEEFGVGPIVAATVLCAWSHPGRIHSEAAFAMLAGVAPIPANSGQVTTRYRLNRYGDRNLNKRTAHRGPEPDPVPASHPRVRRSPYCRRQDRPRDQTLSCPLRRPRPLSPARKRTRRGLTKHRASHTEQSPNRGGSTSTCGDCSSTSSSPSTRLSVDGVRAHQDENPQWAGCRDLEMHRLFLASSLRMSYISPQDRQFHSGSDRVGRPGQVNTG